MGTLTTARASKRGTAYVVAGLLAAMLVMLAAGSARAAQAPVTITQDWPLLSETITGVTSPTRTFPIKRGVLPGGTSTFNPQPSASFEVVGRVTGAVGTGGWYIDLMDDNDSEFGYVTLDSSHSAWSLLSVPITWPASDRALDHIRAAPYGASPGVLDIRSATVRIRQQGTIQKTVGRVPLATRQSGILTEVATRVDEPAFYTHVSADFDPAPVVRLRATGALAGLGEKMRVGLHNSSGAEVGAVTFDATLDANPYSLTSAPLTVFNGQTYEVRVSVTVPNPCDPNCNGPSQQSPWAGGDLLSAELVVAQSTTDPAGIAKTVGWYPSVTAGVDASANNQVLNFPFRAPENLVPETSASFEATAKRVAGTGQVGASLSGLSGTATPMTASGSYVPLQKAMTLLPSPGQQLDTKAALTGTGTTGRFSSSRIRQALTLIDQLPPAIVSAFTASQTHISPGVSIGVQDSVRFTATLADFSSIDWDVEVRSASGSLVRAGSGSGTALDWTWDGKNSSGTVVANGTYTARLIATDGAGNVNDTATRTVIVDTLAPVISGFASDVSRVGPNSTPSVATFSAGLSEQVSWSVRVAKGTWSKTFAGSGTSVSAVWNAPFYNNGDGSYTATLDASDLAGNAASAAVGVVYDATGPVVGNFVRSNPYISPNGDGVKDSTTISATLTDDWTPISWTLQIKQGSTVIRSASGGGNVSYTWDGTDTSGAVVPDGYYTAHLTATDAGNNVRVPSTLSLTVDTVEPTLSSPRPADEANTLWRTFVLDVAVADDRSSVDMTSGSLTLDGQVAPTTYLGGKISTPLANLDVDRAYAVTAAIDDKAGNTGTLDWTFRVISVERSPIEATIGDHTEPVPAALSCPATCSIVFDDVGVDLSREGLLVRSSEHGGFTVPFTRSVPLSGAEVLWQDNLGGTFTTPVTLVSVSTEFEAILDNWIHQPIQYASVPMSVPYGDVSVEVPLQAKRESTAILRMPTVSAAPPCVDSATVANPATCQGPSSAYVDPIGPYQEYLDLPRFTEDPPYPSFAEELAEENAVRTGEWVVAFDDPEEEWENYDPPRVIDDVADYEEGRIHVKVAEGYDMADVAADHAAYALDYWYSSSPPFDESEQELGIDRWYYVEVPVGEEHEAVADLAVDGRTERIELAGVGGSTAYKTPNDSQWDEQWNMKGKYGIRAAHAWAVADYVLNGSSPLDGMFGSRAVNLGVIDTGINGTIPDLNGKVLPGYDLTVDQPTAANADSRCYRPNSGNPPQRDEHGTWVAGINALADNNLRLAGASWNGGLFPVVHTDTSICATNHIYSMDHWFRTARSQGASVATISYGNSVPDKSCEGIRELWLDGVTVVSAAPNPDAPYRIYPGDCPLTIAVAAHGKTGNSSFSGVGASVPTFVDVSAPGVKIPVWGSGGFYDNLAGTSLATPHVSGLAQIMRSMGFPRSPTYNALRFNGDRDTAVCGGSDCGIFNAWRAIRSSPRNGEFEAWDSSFHEPKKWAIGGDCVDSGRNYSSTTQFTPGTHGARSLRLWCTEAGKEVRASTFREITPGWTHEFYARGMLTDDTIDHSQVKVDICWYGPRWSDGSRGPTYECALAIPTISSATTPAGNIATGEWVQISFDAYAPAYAVEAKISLRVIGDTNSGKALFDDVGFYARNPGFPLGLSLIPPQHT